MVRQRRIPLEASGEWQQALKGIRHGFGHTWEHCQAMYLTTGLKTYLYSFEKDDIRIICPIAEREYAGYTDIVKPFGFSGFVGNGDCPEFSGYWKEFAKERGYVCGYLGFNPIFDYSGHFDSKEVYQYDNVFVLDLTSTVDELLANMDRNRRRQLRQWENTKSALVLEKQALEEFFFENYYDFLRERDASPVYFFSEKTLSFLFRSENVVFVGAQDAGKVVAVMVITYTGDVGNALFLVSLPEGQRYSTMLHWFAVTLLKLRGIPVINFGGGGGGVADFKRRFGCKELPLKCLKQIYRPDIYDMLCRQADADPNDMTGYFPAYRQGKSG